MKLRRKESGEILFDCMLQTTKLLINHGINQETAVIIGEDLAQFFAYYWSGLQLYFAGKAW